MCVLIRVSLQIFSRPWLLTSVYIYSYVCDNIEDTKISVQFLLFYLDILIMDFYRRLLALPLSERRHSIGPTLSGKRVKWEIFISLFYCSIHIYNNMQYLKIIFHWDFYSLFSTDKNTFQMHFFFLCDTLWHCSSII